MKALMTPSTADVSQPGRLVADLRPPAIVVIGSKPFAANVPLGDWQLARAFSRLGHPVLYVDPVRPRVSVQQRRLQPACGVLSQVHGVRVLAPVRGIGDRRRIDRGTVVRQVQRAAAALGNGLPLVVTCWSPRGTWDGLRRSALIYWQKDLDWQWARVGDPDLLLRRHEALLRAADVVTGVSAAIVRDSAERGVRATEVPNGCDLSVVVPREARAGGRPRAVFVGQWGWRVDVPLIRQVAELVPEVDFVIVGSVADGQQIPESRNVVHLGPRDYFALPQVLAHADVGLVPYRSSVFNQASCPLKCFEYAAAGLPSVVSGVDVPRLGRAVVRADDPKTFAREVRRAVARPVPGLLDLASRNSWEDRAQTLLALAARVPAQR